MKKILFLLLMTVSVYGQVSTGQEQEFDYGIKNNATQTVTNPDYLTTTGADGTQGKILGNAYTKSDRTININGVTQDLSANRDFQTGYADTGVLTFEGLSANSSTTIDIGACKGWIIDNETNPLAPTKTYVDYAGETNVLVPDVSTAIGSYVLLNSSGITFITTQPTPAQRKAYIYLGKVGHPSGTITVVANTPDNILSPLGQVRALYNAIDFINEGVSVAPNGANLNVNLTAGYITGSGINFVTDDTTPNRLTVSPQTPATFIYRTQTGAGGGATTTITPGVYDVGGVVTAVPGGSNTATVQYIFYAPGAGVFFQLGQTTYPSLSDAVANADKETFTIYPNFVDNVIPIGQLVVIKSATDLSNTSQARFLKADKFGELGGASAGISTATLQSAYNNSLVPQITTSTLGAMTVRRGSASDTDNVLVGQNGAGTNTFAVTGAGVLNLSTNSANAVSGFINKNSLPFIHNFYAGVNPITLGAGQNISVGLNSGNFNSNNFAYASTYIGEEAGKSNTDGYSNVWVGHYVGQSNTTGFGNASVGTNTMTDNVSGSQNASLGWHSLLHHTSGDGNTAVGADALLENLTGQRNTSIGKGSGGLTLGSDNTFLGYNAGNTETGSNKLYISNAFNTLIQGDFSTGNLTLNAITEIRPSSNSWIRFSTSGVSSTTLKWVDNTGGLQNAFIDAYDYIFRTGGSDRMSMSNLGVLKVNNLAGSGDRVVSANSSGELVVSSAPTAPTATAGTNTTQIATTAFVQTATSAARPYKVYTAWFTQSGTDAPSFTVLENTIGSISWSRTGTGTLVATSSGLFTANKTYVSALASETGTNLIGTTFSSSDVALNLIDSSGSLTDGFTSNKKFVEIRVYP